MIDKASRIFTVVKSAVASKCTSASQTYQDTPPILPHIYVNQMDNPSIAEDLDNNENAVKPMVEITTYTEGEYRLADGKEIHSLSDTAMRGMGFKRTFGASQVTNTSNINVCRVIARYTRVICNGDTL